MEYKFGDGIAKNTSRQKNLCHFQQYFRQEKEEIKLVAERKSAIRSLDSQINVHNEFEEDSH
ncbi:hypothetical protein OUZ56_006232 [Daphnia magna]|uniref:Uncharacterized protein n=1 Tax=Daphnia magna TaxID=35525 RepID=A0ABQ9YV27_9CRUS|nr:hypothetical protein OUZ56_006232 [Daphnia magna]